VSQSEKAMLVSKLKGARDRKRTDKATGKRIKVEGRKSYSELNPSMVALAKRLHRYPVNGRRRSLRDIAAQLAEQGFTGKDGKLFGAQSIARMIAA
jgi:hypothetical protein